MPATPDSEALVYSYNPDQKEAGFFPMDFVHLPCDAHVIDYASGVFDSAYRFGNNIFRGYDHAARLITSAGLCGMADTPLDADEVLRISRETFRRNPGRNYLRIRFFRGKGLGVNPAPSQICFHALTLDWPEGGYLKRDENGGVKIGVSSICKSRTDQLPVAAKNAAGYLMGGLAKLEAVRRGLAEVLLLAPDGMHVSEFSGMNLFIVTDDDRLVTPDASASCLMGLTRDTILKIAPTVMGEHACIEERPVGIEELTTAQEIFLVGTAAGIVPATVCEDLPVGSGLPGPVTVALTALYNDIIHARVPAPYPDWLTPVE
jgi:branched-chain amino acid aminotransferase